MASVKRGETLLSIARKLKVRQADLAEANSLTLRVARQAGQQLIIPRAPTTLLAARPDTPEPETVLAEPSTGDLPKIALVTSSLGLFTPVQPMLAKTAATAGDAVTGLGRAFVEWELDGARIQVHRRGSPGSGPHREPERHHQRSPRGGRLGAGESASSFILDGEALLFGPSGPEQFQDSMSRFGADASDQAPPLRAFYFDCLHLDGVDLIDQSLVERRGALIGAVPAESLVGSVLTDDPEMADRFFDDSVAAGYEGVVVKDPNQPYEAGRRGSGWLKVKPTHTLDLLVLAAEWGSGRREGWLSNLHLGAADGDGGYIMLGKTFKGLTDEMLAWQTERFLEIEDHRTQNTVFLRPGIVYEIAFDGIQRSTRYPVVVALRFARVKRYREDKGPGDADSIETVRSFARGEADAVAFQSMVWIRTAPSIPFSSTSAPRKRGT